jgi:hypothetical protein
MRMATAGIFIRPYAAISLREYFATGFEAYYLGNKIHLEKISPMLYDKINELHQLIVRIKKAGYIGWKTYFLFGVEELAYLPALPQTHLH